MRVRRLGAAKEWNCVESTRYPRAMILSIGTAMLATNTTIDSGQDPDVHRYTTPLRIVSFWAPKRELVYITGRALAGRYSTMAAISSAHVREIAAGFLLCIVAPHRGQATA